MVVKIYNNAGNMLLITSGARATMDLATMSSMTSMQQSSALQAQDITSSYVVTTDASPQIADVVTMPAGGGEVRPHSLFGSVRKTLSATGCVLGDMSAAQKAFLIGGSLVAAGSFFLDPMTAMLGLPLLGMVTNRASAVEKNASVDTIALAAAPRKRSLGRAVEAARQVLNLWFDQSFQELYSAESPAGRKGLLTAFVEGLKAADHRAEGSVEEGVKLPFDYTYERKIGDCAEKTPIRLTGSITVRFPPRGGDHVHEIARGEFPFVDQPLADLQIVEVTFNAPWAAGKRVSLVIKYGGKLRSDPQKGFGVKHIEDRHLEEMGGERDKLLDFIIHKALAVVMKQRAETAEGHGREAGRRFQGDDAFGKFPNLIARVALEKRGSGVYSLTTAFVPDKRDLPSSGAQSSAARPTEANYRNAVQQMRDADKTIVQGLDGVYIVRKGKAGEKALQRVVNAGRAIIAWTVGSRTRARIWEIDPNTPTHEVSAESRLQFDDFIGKLQESRGQVDGTHLIDHLTFLRDKIMPRLDADAQEYLAMAVEIRMEEFEALKADAKYQTPEVYRREMQKWVDVCVRGLYNEIAEETGSVEGLSSHEIAFDSSGKR